MSTTVPAELAKSPAAAPARVAPDQTPTAPQLDNRPSTVAQRQVQAAIGRSPRVQQAAALQRAIDNSPRQQAAAAGPAPAPVQRQENQTGLPDQLKAGVENLSGHSLDDVRVHYNSAAPAQLQAHAYAQGSDIHLAPGQEKHLPHEAWHVAQQKQGRVKPTMQLKGKVAVNDDAGLEHEADVMGQRALGTPAATTQLQVRALAGSAPAQLVKDKSQRTALDARMTTLKQNTVALLDGMREQGQDWEKTYAAKGKEKGSSILDGKKTDYRAEVRNALLKQAWKQLSTQEKAELLAEAARLTGGGIVGALRGVGEVVGLLPGLGAPSGGLGLPSSGGGGKEKKDKEKAEPKPREEREESSSGSWLSGLSQEHLAALQRAYSLVREGQEKYEEAKDKVRETGGEVGGAIGGQLGRLRDDLDFKRRMKEHRPAFFAARRHFELLEEAINDNQDRDRYTAELDALSNALFGMLYGPGMAYVGDGLDDQRRRDYAEVCQEAIADIKASARNKGGLLGAIREAASEAASSVGRAVTGLADGGASERATLAAVQGELASEIGVVVNKKWGKFTSWRSTPTTVSAIRKALPTKGTDVAKLREAVRLADAGGTNSNRTPHTQAFYEALSGLDVQDLQSLRETLSTVKNIGAKLG